MLKRCGEGYDENVLAFRFPNMLLVDPLGAISRFFNVSFFSRCSRWIGVEPGAGVFEGAREEGLSGDGTAGMWSLGPTESAIVAGNYRDVCMRWRLFDGHATR